MPGLSGQTIDLARATPAELEAIAAQHQPAQALPTNSPPTFPLPPSALPLPSTSHQSLVTSHLLNHLPTLWLIGAPLTFTLLATGLLGSARLRRRATSLAAGPAFDACERLRQTLNITRRVALAACDGVAQPILVGVLRPLILLPTAALAGWTPEQLDMVLLHELAHVRRWDNLVNLLQRIVESLLFFHPAVWLLSRQVRRDREECCDAAVIAHTDRPHQYAELLVSIAAALRGGPAPSLAVASAMASHPLAGRIRRILNLEEEPMRITRRTLAATLLLPLLLAGAIFYSGASAQDPPPSKGGARGGIPDAKQPNTPYSDGEKAKSDGDEDSYTANYPIQPNTQIDLVNFAKAVGGHNLKLDIVADEWAIVLHAPKYAHNRLRVLLGDKTLPQPAAPVAQPAESPLSNGPAPASARQNDDLKTQADIPQLQNEIRNLESLITKTQKQLVDLEVFKELSIQASQTTTVRDELDADRNLNDLNAQLLSVDKTIESEEYDGPKLAELESLRNKIENEREQYHKEAAKAIRDRLEKKPNEDLRAAIVEYKIRRKSVEENLANYEQQLAAANAKLRQLSQSPVEFNAKLASAGGPGSPNQGGEATRSTPEKAPPTAPVQELKLSGEIPQLQNEIRNLEALFVKAQEELVNFEVYEEIIGQSGHPGRNELEAAIAAELDLDATLNLYKQQLFELNSTLQTKLTESKNSNTPEIRRLRATIQKAEADMAKYQMEVARTLREKYAHIPKDAKQAAEREYNARRKAAEANLAKRQQELAAAKTKLSQLTTNPGASAPQPTPLLDRLEQLRLAFDQQRPLFVKQPGEQLQKVHYDGANLPDIVGDHWPYLIKGISNEPGKPPISFNWTGLGNKNYELEVPAAAHEKLFRPMFDGMLPTLAGAPVSTNQSAAATGSNLDDAQPTANAPSHSAASPLALNPNIVKLATVFFPPNFPDSEQERERIRKDFEATGLTATAGMNGVDGQTLPCIYVRVPDHWNPKPVWESLAIGNEIKMVCRIIDEPVIAIAGEGNPASPNQDGAVPGSDPNDAQPTANVSPGSAAPVQEPVPPATPASGSGQEDLKQVLSDARSRLKHEIDDLKKRAEETDGAEAEAEIAAALEQKVLKWQTLTGASDASVQKQQTSPFPTLENQKIADRAYKLLGLELEPATSDDLQRIKNLGYAGGLRVVAVDPDKQRSLISGCLLVGLHVWPTPDLQALDAILTRDDLDELSPLKFRVIAETPTEETKDPNKPVMEDRLITGRMPIDLEALRSIRRTLPSNHPNAAAFPNGPAPPPDNAASVTVVQPPISSISGPTKNHTQTTAYLKISFHRLPGAFSGASGTFNAADARLTPQEIELQALNCLAIVKSPTVLKAALEKITPREKVDMEPANAAWLQNRLSATFPGDGEILELKLEGGDAKEDHVLLQAVIDAFIAAMNPPPESPADPNATTKSNENAADALNPFTNFAHSSSPDEVNGPPTATFLYDGKTFDQWRDLWKLELNPERRIEAVSAMAAFSRAGYGDEAINAILDVAAEYDFALIGGDAEGKLKERIIKLFTDYVGQGPPKDPWLPIVLDRMKADPDKWRSLVEMLLYYCMPPHRMQHNGPPIMSAENVEILKKAIGDERLDADILFLTTLNKVASHDPDVVRMTKEALQSDDVEGSLNLLRFIGFSNVDELPEQLEFLFAADLETRQAARDVLARSSGPQVRDAVADKLLAILNDPNQSARHADAIRALAMVSSSVVPTPHGHHISQGKRQEIIDSLYRVAREGATELFVPAVAASHLFLIDPDIQPVLESSLADERVKLLEESKQQIEEEKQSLRKGTALGEQRGGGFF